MLLFERPADDLPGEVWSKEVTDLGIQEDVVVASYQ